METDVTKDGAYQNPEYKSYHTYSYLDMQLQLDHCRLEQPVAGETDCRGKIVHTQSSEPKCGGIIQ
jgi:NADH dehydrogenase [ubiquinone] flavoprotein 3, mitochondrial